MCIRDRSKRVLDELIECAKTISNLDYKMQGIHEELSKPQKRK